MKAPFKLSGNSWFFFLLPILVLRSALATEIDCAKTFAESPPRKCENLAGEERKTEVARLRRELSAYPTRAGLEVDAALDFALHHSLCSDEVAAIQEYTNLLYSVYNKALRSGTAGEAELRVRKDICLIKNGLSKLENYAGMSYRGVGLSRSEAERYLTSGSIVEENSFISTDSDPKIALQFAYKWKPVRIVFQFLDPPGPSIQPISPNPDEHEVLIPPGKRFRVESVVPQNDGSDYYLILMRTIP